MGPQRWVMGCDYDRVSIARELELRHLAPFGDKPARPLLACDEHVDRFDDHADLVAGRDAELLQ